MEFQLRMLSPLVKVQNLPNWQFIRGKGDEYENCAWFAGDIFERTKNYTCEMSILIIFFKFPVNILAFCFGLLSEASREPQDTKP